jgi:hypothetical protein
MKTRLGVAILAALAMTGPGCAGDPTTAGDAAALAAPSAACREVASECRAEPPAGLTAVGRSTGIVVLSWAAPAAAGRCAPLGYLVSADGRPVAFTEETTAAVAGLQPGSTHTFTVKGEYRRGPGASATVTAATALAPDLGPNALVFDPSMAPADVQAQVNQVYDLEHTAQFGADRFALLFRPGTYDVDVPVGYYTQVAGLGALPGQVRFTKNVHSEAAYGWQPQGDFNATQNFWRSVENLTVVPVDLEPGATGFPNTMRWAVSQACPFRRVHVQGNVHLHHWWGWASGGWMADSKIDGEANSGSQQQWVSRNTEFGSWSNVNWNMVFVGDVNPFPGAWPDQHTTIVERTPVVREKPFLFVDGAGAWRVFLPALQRDTQGVTWTETTQSPGRARSIDRFYVARPSDSAATLNAALDAGADLLLTPGIYHLDRALEVRRPGTIVLGLGFATLHPDTGQPAMTIADVGGVTVAGLLFDAGTVSSPVLLQVGPEGSRRRHAQDPTALHDLFFRVGGAEAGKADVGLVLNSHDVIGDHFWIWRADHGSGVGWTENPSANGLVVNGDDVTIYGLFVEHFERYQAWWRGERGRVYFYQSEDPYDVPDQASWMDGAKNGFASYKVADGVASHEAWGLGIYSVFTSFPAVQDSAIEVPLAPGVKMHDMVTFGLAQGTVSHVVNDQGGPATSNPWQQGVVVNYPGP